MQETAMRQHKRSPDHDSIEASTDTAGSIGALERLAGIGARDHERATF